MGILIIGVDTADFVGNILVFLQIAYKLMF